MTSPAPRFAGTFSRQPCTRQSCGTQQKQPPERTHAAVTVDHVLELGRSAVMVTILVGAPVMVSAVFAGLVVSVLQAVTQLQDQTLAFVPKILVMLLTLLYALPWLLSQMTEFATGVFQDIPGSL